jgi:protein MAK11
MSRQSTAVARAAAGAEDGCLRAWDCRTSVPALVIPKAHGARIRGLAVAGPAGGEAPGPLPALVATASTDGVVRLWDLRMGASR